MTTSAQNFDPSKLTFGEAKTVKADHGEFKLIPLSYDGGKKKLSVLTAKCFSWGLQKDKGIYKLPILLKEKNATSGELEPTKGRFRTKDFVDCFKKNVLRCKQLCLENKSSLGRHDLEASELKGIGNCLYVKKDKD